MKITKILLYFVIFSFFFATSCASVPKEAVMLSKQLAETMEKLHESHRATVTLLYKKSKDSIHDFVDNKYAPYIIHYVLKADMNKYRNGQTSLLYNIQNAPNSEQDSQIALHDMQEFMEAANRQIAKYRQELIDPILEQEKKVLRSIDESYKNVFAMNNTLTNHLESLYKLNKSAKDIYSLIGAPNAYETISDTAINTNETINKIIKSLNLAEETYDAMKDTFHDFKNKIIGVTR